MVPSERSVLIAKERERAKAIDAAIATCRLELNRAAQIGSDDLVRIHNLAIYVCLAERDQGLLKVDALGADPSDQGRLSFVARQWATLLYEVAGDIRKKAFTKPMRETILALMPEGEPELNAINSLAQAFWNTRSQELRHWRNVACAHRDFDALLQLRVVEEIDILPVMQRAGEFAEVPRRLIPFLTSALFSATGLQGGLKVLRRAKRI